MVRVSVRFATLATIVLFSATLGGSLLILISVLFDRQTSAIDHYRSDLHYCFRELEGGVVEAGQVTRRSSFSPVFAYVSRAVGDHLDVHTSCDSIISQAIERRETIDAAFLRSHWKRFISAEPLTNTGVVVVTLYSTSINFRVAYQQNTVVYTAALPGSGTIVDSFLWQHGTVTVSPTTVSAIAEQPTVLVPAGEVVFVNRSLGLMGSLSQLTQSLPGMVYVQAQQRVVGGTFDSMAAGGLYSALLDVNTSLVVDTTHPGNDSLPSIPSDVTNPLVRCLALFVSAQPPLAEGGLHEWTRLHAPDIGCSDVVGLLGEEFVDIVAQVVPQARWILATLYPRSHTVGDVTAARIVAEKSLSDDLTEREEVVTRDFGIAFAVVAVVLIASLVFGVNFANIIATNALLINHNMAAIASLELEDLQDIPPSRFWELNAISRNIKDSARYLTEVMTYLPAAVKTQQHAASPSASPRATVSPARSEERRLASGQTSPKAKLPVDPNLAMRTVTVCCFSYSGFETHAQDSLSDAEAVSEAFLAVVLPVVESHGGIVKRMTCSMVLAAWNAFMEDDDHCISAANCTLEVRRVLDSTDLSLDAPSLAGLPWNAAIATGRALVGRCGTNLTRTTALEGPCVDVVQMLPDLLHYLGCKIAVTADVQTELLARGYWCVPVEFLPGSIGTLYHLRSEAIPEEFDTDTYTKAFAAFVAEDYKESEAGFTHFILGNAAKDTQALRLLKLSLYYQTSECTHRRRLPRWPNYEEAAAAVELPQSLNVPSTIHFNYTPTDIFLMEEEKNLKEEINIRILQKSPRPAQIAASPDKSAMDNVPSLMLTEVDKPLTPKVGSPSPSPKHLMPSPKSSSLTASVSQPLPVSPRSTPSPTSSPKGLRSPKAKNDNLGSNSLGTTPVSGRLTIEVSSPTLVIQESSDNYSPKGAMSQVSRVLRVNNELPCEFSDSRKMVWRLSESVLGEGAFGKVYLGMAEHGALVAIKTMKVAHLDNPQSEVSTVERRRQRRRGSPSAPETKDIQKELDNLLGEVALLSRLRHEHIVGYLSSALVTSYLCVVMEFVSGGSLHSVLKQFPSGIPQLSARRYLKDTVLGLHFLHKEGIIHRDIKPGNVLLMIDGSCKLTDFGTSAHINKLTGTTDLQGTPQYMAPEAARGQATKKSDIWSFGITVCELLTGKLPWPEDDVFVPARFIYTVAHQDTMVPEVPDCLSPEASELVGLCCQRDESLRPSTEAILRLPFFA